MSERTTGADRPAGPTAHEILAAEALDPVAELAAILAKGYLRLLARKAAPVADKAAVEGLDDVADKSVHGAGLTEGAP